MVELQANLADDAGSVSRHNAKAATTTNPTGNPRLQIEPAIPATQGGARV